MLQQLLGCAQLHQATAAQVPAHGAATDYGYLWWAGEADDSPAYLAWGYGGQLIEVVPDLSDAGRYWATKGYDWYAGI